ncbi:DUF2971 domain-containing protein [Vibrio cholerae]|uniref:DUF2971 domain-containing protein n=1 Tax=Vibrio cholerae TaxID=666 RepID=UPI00196424C4|nr:DUF2971 domain-containing protein [Vibrio cholerae]
MGRVGKKIKMKRLKLAISEINLNSTTNELGRMEKIYKYFSYDVLDLVFAREGFCGVKCSLPKDYNDPYELFLGMDLSIPTEHLAFYHDVISGIPQNPTTCFSYSPIVSPMWAHYANNHSGFVLEFDLDGLQKHFEGNPIWKVSYRKAPLESLKGILARAAGTLKPRHSYALQEAVFVESYFSKYDQWSYEQECRFVDMKKVTENVAGNDILFIPLEFVTAFIAGPKFPSDMVQRSNEITAIADMKWYELVIGKSHPQPYVKDDNSDVFIFKDKQLVLSVHNCNLCSEPLVNDNELCPWCTITESHREIAAQRNPFRMISAMGGLEEYMEAMSKIGR